ncbi:Bax inhibitor-1 family protein, partial [Burkholderia gladioli]
MGNDFRQGARAEESQRLLGGDDVGLRQYMRHIYNYMAGGLALTGAVAYFGASTGFYRSIAGTPLFWVVLLAPLALVMFLSFR